MIKERLSGVLLHPTSFPSRYGIGDLGKEAYNFIDFLYASKQKLWQILPLGPVNESYSPYQSTSAFAGNFLLISLEKLVDEGLLGEGDMKELEFVNYDINYNKAKQIKIPLLQKAYNNYCLKGELSEYNTLKMFLSEGTVRNNISALLLKLKLRDRTQLAIYAVKNDYI